MDNESRHWAESFKPSEDIKETIPAGSMYKSLKSFVQFYDKIRLELEVQLKEAEADFEALKSEADGIKITKKEITIPAKCDLYKVARWIDAGKKIIKIQQSLDKIKELGVYEENDAHKIGLSELAELIRESEPMMAMSVSGKRD